VKYNKAKSSHIKFSVKVLVPSFICTDNHIIHPWSCPFKTRSTCTIDGYLSATEYHL